MHDETRQLFERLVADRTVLRIYRIDDWGTPWVQCPCPGQSLDECVEELGINEYDVWELVAQSEAPADVADRDNL